jgi:hypothetical protein
MQSAGAGIAMPVQEYIAASAALAVSASSFSLGEAGGAGEFPTSR